jgi:signal transduction histidine kinase
LDGSAGVVHVGFTEANIRTVVANIIRQIIGIIIATLVLGIGVAIVVAIVITKPISEIADVAKAVGGGDFGRKVQVKTKDEIGELGAVFNKMINERKQAEERLLTYQERLRSLSSELFLAEERERRRIATGLHDHIGQTLVFSKIKLGEIQKSWPSSSPSGALIEIKELIDQMIKETRSLTFELSLPVLYELGLEPAIEWLAERNQELYGIPTGFYDDGRPKPLEDSVRVFLFQSARELLFNIAKHSRAQNSNVSIHRNGGNIEIEIDDDGVGFEMSGPNLEKSRNKGFGLFSIRERLSHIGGRLDLKTEPGRGTKAVLIAPLQH